MTARMFGEREYTPSSLCERPESELDIFRSYTVPIAISAINTIATDR